MFTCCHCGHPQTAPVRWPHCRMCEDLPECQGSCGGTIGLDDNGFLDVYQSKDGESVCEACYRAEQVVHAT